MASGDVDEVVQILSDGSGVFEGFGNILVYGVTVDIYVKVDAGVEICSAITEPT